MATYDSLNTVEKAIVDNVNSLLRSAAAKQAQLYNLVTAIANDTNAIAILTTIDAGEELPNPTSFAGSDNLTRTELQALYTQIKAIRDTEDTPTNRAAWSKAAGINALTEIE